MAEPTGPCRHCGAVLPLSALMKVGAEGAWEYVCQDCAVVAPTGTGPESREPGARKRRAR